METTTHHMYHRKQFAKKLNPKSDDKVETDNAINPLKATNDVPEIKVKESELETLKRQRKAIKMGEDEPSLMPK